MEPLSGSAGETGQAADRLRAAWMAAAQDGDGAAYEKLLLDCLPMIRSAAMRTGMPRGLLDDTVQDILLTVHRVRHTYDPRRSFNAWLWVIAQRRAVDALRRHGRHLAREAADPEAAANHPDPARSALDQLADNDAHAQLHLAIATLPAAQREAVEQLGLEQKSLDEAACDTGRSRGALKVNLHRALAGLRARLAGRIDP